jgi:hypothetical protein
VKTVILLRSFAGLSRKALPAGFVRRAAARSAEHDADKPVPRRLARVLAAELASTLDVGAIEREVAGEEVPA